MATKWPTGIRPSGSGIRVTIWHQGRAAFDRTIAGNAASKADLAAAVRFRDELKQRLKLGLGLPGDERAKRRVFGEMAQGYLESRSVDGSTAQNYTSWLNRHWMPVFGGRIIEEITRQEVQDTLAQLPLSTTTKRAVLSPLAGVFGYAGIHPNPAGGIKLERQTRGRVERYTPAERDAVLASLNGQDRVYFGLLFGTGMRPGEAIALEWPDYNGQELSVTKQRTRSKLKTHTKTKADRVVYVPEWVRDLLNSHHTRLAGGSIFLTNTGEPFHKASEFNKAWREAHKKARVGAHPVRCRRPYTCRHTRASELLSRGVAPAAAAAQLGHSVQMFLEIYARFVQEYAASVDMSQYESEKPMKRKGERL